MIINYVNMEFTWKGRICEFNQLKAVIIGDM